MELLLLLLLVLILFCFRSKLTRLLTSTNVLSTIDNKYYTVRNIPGKQQAADTLAEINKRVQTLLSSLPDESGGNISLLKKRYSSNNLTENIELQETSYTLNKEYVNMCLATRDSTEQIYDINLLMYVLLHELAHIGCESVGHTEEFKKFFHYLTKKSVDIGILKYVDYSSKNEEYCGIQLTNHILN